MQAGGLGGVVRARPRPRGLGLGLLEPAALEDAEPALLAEARLSEPEGSTLELEGGEEPEMTPEAQAAQTLLGPGHAAQAPDLRPGERVVLDLQNDLEAKTKKH